MRRLPHAHDLAAATPALLCCVLAFAVGAAAADPAASPDLSVRDIVARAIVRDTIRQDRRLVLEADQTIVTKRLDASGKVLSTKTTHAIFHPTAQISFSTNTESVSSSSSGQPDADTVKAQQIIAVMNLGKLAPSFTETLTGSATIQGRDCYAVSYSPKPGQSADTREEKVVHNTSGHFWIAKDNFDIVQSEGSLVSPVTVALIASVTRMDFKYRSQLLPNGDIGPAEISVDLAYHAPFYDFRQLQVNSLTNWRPRH